MFSQLSNDDIDCVIDKLKSPRDLLRLMMTSKSLMSSVKSAGMWTRLRIRADLPVPNPRSRKYRSDFDVFAKKACKICFLRRYQKYGICHICRDKYPDVISADYRLQNAYSDMKEATKTRNRIERDLVKARQHVETASIHVTHSKILLQNQINSLSVFR